MYARQGKTRQDKTMSVVGLRGILYGRIYIPYISGFQTFMTTDPYSPQA